MPIAYLSLGSNLGNRYENIKNAVNLLRSKSKIEKISSIYLTSPVENKNQPWFYNCVVKISTTLSVWKLFRLVKDIEKLLGRDNSTKRYQPRIIDIDILFYNNKIIRTNSLSIPHKKLHKRKFVLYPMEEISSGLVHPVLRKRISTLKKLLNDPTQKVKLKIPAKKVIDDLSCN